jgi:hypothetical protein
MTMRYSCIYSHSSGTKYESKGRSTVLSQVSWSDGRGRTRKKVVWCMERSKVVGVLARLEFERFSMPMQVLANRNKPAPSRSRVASIRWSLNCIWYSEISQNSLKVFWCSSIRSRNVPLAPVSTKSLSSSEPLCSVSSSWHAEGKGWGYTEAGASIASANVQFA